MAAVAAAIVAGRAASMTAPHESALFGEVPVLIVRPGGADGAASRGKATALPTVVWFHGFGADKERHLPELQRFAAAGLLAIGVDAVGHGQRRLPDFERLVARSPSASAALFESLLAQTVAEVPRLIDTLVDRGLTDPQRIHVAGVSMGGCIVYGAIAADRRVGAAAALLGSPAWLCPDGVDFPLDRFFPTALLSIAAENDAVVPPPAAQALHQRLVPAYARQPDRLRYRVIPGASHFMLPEQWAGAVGQASAWLARF